jgi:hypothetical protein
MLFEFHEEFYRKGNFIIKIINLKDNLKGFIQFYKMPTFIINIFDFKKL